MSGARRAVKKTRTRNGPHGVSCGPFVLVTSSKERMHSTTREEGLGKRPGGKPRFIPNRPLRGRALGGGSPVCGFFSPGSMLRDPGPRPAWSLAPVPATSHTDRNRKSLFGSAGHSPGRATIARYPGSEWARDHSLAGRSSPPDRHRIGLRVSASGCASPSSPTGQAPRASLEATAARVGYPERPRGFSPVDLGVDSGASRMRRTPVRMTLIRTIPIIRTPPR